MESNLPIVLIVDDSPESIDVLRGVLGVDYRVFVAISGIKALDIAQRINPDIILLDVMMPDLDGYETCKRLKTIPALAQTPIMFVTTLSETDNQLHGLELGAVDYITKPYVASLVRSRVSSHVSLFRHVTQLEKMVKLATSELLDTRLEIIRRLGRAAEYRDNETGMHIMRMSHITKLLALAHGMSEADAEILFQASPMHDVGKIGVPDHILMKPGKLDDDEWKIIKKHTIIGAEIIGDHTSPLMETARVVALRHHERFDGTGYPGGLKGKEIPLEARIAALTDVFDALLSIRPYKPAWSLDDTLAYIKENKGRHFDPQLAEEFLQILPECLAVREEFRDE
jgi:putative two-component system response regulator